MLSLSSTCEHVDRDEALRQITDLAQAESRTSKCRLVLIYDIYDEHLMHHRRYRLSNL